MMTVTAIVPCRNEKRFIRSCLNSIVEQNYPKDHLEVLVVDGGSRDGTREILEEYRAKHSFIRILDNPQHYTPCAMNIGIRAARGGLIIKMDAHTVYGRDYISACERYMREYDADNVGGVLRPITLTDTPVSRAIKKTISSLFGVGSSFFRIGSSKPIYVDTVAFGCYKRSVFDRIGLYNEKLIRGQDMELNLRLKKAGGRILLHPDIKAEYYIDSELGAFIGHNFKNGVWSVLPFMYSRIIPVSPRHLVPLYFVTGLLTLWSLSFFHHVFLMLLFAAQGVYCLAALAFSAVESVREKDPFLFPVLPFTFASLHFSYGIGAVWGLFSIIGKRATALTGKMLKRLFDLVFSTTGLLLLSPVFLFLSLAIKLHDGGPVFYAGVRTGLNGKKFRMLKFRSMVVNADKIGGPSTADDDPRLLKIGKVMRKFKLDELPQLINVLKGDMSFVGPRPEVPFYTDMFTPEERRILSVRPGITDFASLWNSDEGAILAGSADPEKTYMEKIRPEKLRLQLKYVDERSFFVDLVIIMKTLLKIIRR